MSTEDSVQLRLHDPDDRIETHLEDRRSGTHAIHRDYSTAVQASANRSLADIEDSLTAEARIGALLDYTVQQYFRMNRDGELQSGDRIAMAAALENAEIVGRQFGVSEELMERVRSSIAHLKSEASNGPAQTAA